ncbi:hypothetical protein [Streptomyces scopuliridis]|uniref:hypothetical protein n=1 Tax=Streptomyces scopuliridis TaxID=452529 RepID=UPI0035DC6827
MSTASDRVDPDEDRCPPLLGAQYVGWGTAIREASAHQITINNTFAASTQNPWAFQAMPYGPGPGPFQALRRLRSLTSQLVMFADCLHAAAEALEALSLPSEDPATPSSYSCSSGAPGLDRKNRQRRSM